MAVDELYWDPFDHAMHLDSHPVWRRMREEAPLYRNEKFDFWALTRFDDVLQALVDWKSYTSTRGDVIEVIKSPMNEFTKDAIIHQDPPSHTLQRQLLSRAFTPRAVKKIEDRVSEFAGALLDDRVGSGGFDFVDDFGAIVPAMVIASMLGTPDSDIHEIRHLTDAQLELDDGEMEDRSRFDESANRLGEYFLARVQESRKQPGDDLVSALVQLEFTDESGVSRKLTDLEATQYIHLLSGAGNETTARFTGWAGETLARFPEQRAKLVARPELIDNGIEEILRFEPPAMALARVVTQDVTWHDQVVPEGATLVLVQASTGRDQRQFADPDVLDVERKIDRHLSFGFGVHVCMGASLARLEGRIVVREMLQRFPEWEVDWDGAEMVHAGSTVRGYRRLPIRVA